MQAPIGLDVNSEWHTSNLLQVAAEALGKRKKKLNKRGLHIWNDDLADKKAAKKDGYLKKLNHSTDENKIIYKRLSATVKREVRKVKRQSREKIVCNSIEHDVHGRQIKAYKY
jgi:hypothetical protein